jgi:tetratricopeptide (TPR) repeat protein
MDASSNLAFMYAGLGDAARARRAFVESRPAEIPNPKIRALYEQVFDALVALKSGRAGDAVKRLAELPLDNKHSLVLNGLFIRAEALAATGRWPEAERDYREVLKRKPDLHYNLVGPLSHLGIARSLAARGNTGGAREEYKVLLDLWSQADSDLAVLQKVKTESGKLGT